MQILEELDERKLEEDLDKMVDIVVQVFPPHPNEQNVDEEALEDGSPEMPVDANAKEPKAGWFSLMRCADYFEDLALLFSELKLARNSECTNTILDFWANSVCLVL